MREGTFPYLWNFNPPRGRRRTGMAALPPASGGCKSPAGGVAKRRLEALHVHDCVPAPDRGLEVDAIVECHDGRWAAFEAKLGQSQVDEAAATLRAFADCIDTKKCGDPAALAVITGNGYGYVRPDGMAVIPIGTLGP